MACKKKDKKIETPITEAQIPGVEALNDQEAGQVSGGKIEETLIVNHPDLKQ